MEVMMENPRPEKVAVVAEVSACFAKSNAVLVTEYRRKGFEVHAHAEQVFDALLTCGL